MYVEVASRDSGEIQAFEDVEFISCSGTGLLQINGFDFEALFLSSEYFVFYAEV